VEAVLDSTPAVTSRPALPRLRSVLVATDFSAHCARAVDRAALLAREHAVDLALMHVVAPTRDALRAAGGHADPAPRRRG